MKGPLRMLLPVLLLCVGHGAFPSSSNPGYLGKVNLVSLGIHDLIWTDAVALSYLRCIDRRGGVRLDIKIFQHDRYLFHTTPGWLDIGGGKKIGTAVGNGWTIGVFQALNLAPEIAAPLGYFFATGVEYFSGTTTEIHEIPIAGALNAIPDPPAQFNFKHSGFRFMNELGIRHILTRSLMVELGMQFGMNISYKIESIDHDQPALLHFPYERTGFFGEQDEQGEGVFKVAGGFFMNPMLRMGWVF